MSFLAPALLGAALATGMATGLACASSPANPQAETTELPVSDEMVRMTLKRVDLARPPMAQLRVDVQLHNRDAAPRWFLLPKSLESKGGGVDGVEIARGGGAVVGRFQGRGGVQALLLPPGGRVVIRGLAIESWAEELPPTIETTVRVGSALTVGGEPAEAWMGQAACAASVDTTAEALQASGSRFTPDRSAVPLELADAVNVKVTLVLP